MISLAHPDNPGWSHCNIIKLTRLAKAFLPCKIIYSQGPGIRILTSSCVDFGGGMWGGIILPTTVEKKQWDWVRNPGLKWRPGNEVLGVFPSIHRSSSSGVTHNSGLSAGEGTDKGNPRKSLPSPAMGGVAGGGKACRAMDALGTFPTLCQGRTSHEAASGNLQISKHKFFFFFFWNPESNQAKTLPTDREHHWVL